MTDEEKAMTSFKKNNCEVCENKDACNTSILNCIEYVRCYEDAYLAGLEEGRKKEADLIFESWCKGSDNEQCECGFLKKIEKENAELKKQLEVTNKENERIRRTMLTYSECITEHQNTIKRKDKENAELKEQNKDLCESLDIMNNRESELLEQIEKMKRCENCNKENDENCWCNWAEYHCSRWELAL